MVLWLLTVEVHERDNQVFAPLLNTLFRVISVTFEMNFLTSLKKTVTQGLKDLKEEMKTGENEREGLPWESIESEE